MSRTINDILTDINGRVAADLDYPANMFGLAVLQPVDGKTFPMRRISDHEGKKISPNDTRGMQFYHRMLNQTANPVGGKGGKVYYDVTYSMLLVGLGYRGNITSSPNWNNEDLAKKVMQILGSNATLSNKELLLAQGQTTTDKLTVLSTEYAGNPDIKKWVLDLIAFSINYTIKQKIVGVGC